LAVVEKLAKFLTGLLFWRPMCLNFEVQNRLRRLVTLTTVRLFSYIGTLRTMTLNGPIVWILRVFLKRFGLTYR